MIPTWMIEELERRRQERESWERSRAQLELPDDLRGEREEDPASAPRHSTVIVIEL